jgi:uncharacterized repeat protein (TIGR03803 family)
MKVKLIIDKTAKQVGLLQCVVVFQLLLCFFPTHAQFEPIFSFDGATKGSHPAGSLIFDGTYLYGMTSQGGVNNFGTIFKVKPDGSDFKKLLDFNGGNGRLPQGSLMFDGTFLYGMTYYGGSRNTGAMFKIKPDGTGYTKLWDFGGLSFGMPNAAYPYGGLLLNGDYLYGMASFGGVNAGGVIFKIKPDGTGFAKLRDLFVGGIVRDGADPWGSLISDGTYLYGTARLGGIGLGGGWPEGAVFKIKPDGTGYSKLFDCTGANGSQPTGDLLYDGNFLYGTTSYYGSGGGGTVFKVKPDGTEYSTLHNFNGANGRWARGSLISDGTFLYGMTSEGGTNNLGTIFKIKPDGSGFVKLMSFKGASTGSSPALGSLVSDGSFLYGMTYRGGDNNLGVLFKYALGPWPNISSFTPSQGPVGTTVTITGSDFDPIAGNNVVLFNGTPADVTSSTATSITTKVPMRATTGGITLTVGNKTTSSETDFIVTPPVITSFSPIAGPPETVVTIVGTDFDQKCANNVVSFNGTPAPVIDCTTTSITVSVPAGATTGSITVTVGSNTAISSISFKVVDRLVFAPKVDYPVYVDPREIEVADFNLDGHLDLATPSFGAIAILYGTGAGCFDTQLDLPASLTLSSIAASDLNFDGWIDIVGTNGSTETVSVYINSGSGFYPPTDYASGPQSSTLSIGDVNADGAPDLVIVNNDTPGSISILLNNLWGEFNAATPYPTASNPNYVAIGDMNRDSWADLVITNSSQSVSIFINDGTGRFLIETQYPTTKFSNGTVLNDFDRDSDLDVAVANTDGNSVDIMLNDGSGLYSINTDFQTNTTGGYGPGSIVAGDFNNDGNADLLTGSYAGTASILLGDGSGWFAPGQTFATGNGLYDVNLGDVDEDGLLDIVTANSSDNTVSVLLTSGNACGAPTITGFTPLSAAAGTTVIITGTNFDPIAANNDVKFNGVSALTPSAPSSTSLTVIVPAGATTGPISVTTAGGTGVSSTDFTVTCVPPLAPSASSVSRCGSGTVTLTATGSTGTQEYRWYVVATGGTSLSSIATFTTPSVTTTTSFYVSIFDVTTSCESNRTQVDAIVNTPPVAPTPINNSGCSGTSISVSASGGSAGQYRWYAAAIGGTHDAAQTNDSYLTPTLTLTTSYYVAIHNGTCESARTEVVATIIPIPSAPSVQIPEARCPGANVTLRATGATGGQYRWYEGGVLIPGASSSSYTVVNITTDKTFEVSIFNTCESAKTSVSATVVDCTLPPAEEPSVIGSAGDYFASASGSLAWTLGEVITETFTNDTKILTQGFHQPQNYIITGLPEETSEFLIYPNPVQDWLIVKTSASSDYHIEIFNLHGQKIVEQEAIGVVGTHLHHLDMRQMANAVYLLHITNNLTGKTSTHKILKY